MLSKSLSEALKCFLKMLWHFVSLHFSTCLFRFAFPLILEKKLLEFEQTSSICISLRFLNPQFPEEQNDC